MSQVQSSSAVSTALRLETALLEHWMRLYYFEVDYDIGSSGVEDYSMRQIRELLDISWDEIDELVFHDSQTLGGEGARQALADRFLRGDASRAMITHGSTEANFLIMTGLLEPGDEVVVLDPFYQQLYAVAEGVGCELKRWPLRPQAGFRPDFADLRRLVTPRTRMIVVNFPHNPTGATLTRDEQRQLVAAAEAVGAYLVWDGAFTTLTYDSDPLPEPVLDYERALSMGTFSKAYGLPGLRVGWVLAAPEILEVFAHLRDYTLLHLSPLVELLATKVLRHAERLTEPRRVQATAHRQLVDDWICERPHQIRWTLPQGGVCGFPELLVGDDVEALCHRLAQEQRVLLVPGVCFGMDRHVRLGFGGSRENLEGGLGRLGELLDQL